MAKRKHGPGGNAKRTSVITVRLSPRLRHAVEFTARVQLRTLSNLIEWALEDAMRRYEIEYKDLQHGGIDVRKITALQAAEMLWDVEEPDRFANLAFNFPNLMTLDEQRLWALITTSSVFWVEKDDGSGLMEWDHRFPNNLIRERLREYWLLLKRVAAGELDRSAIPQPPHNEEESGTLDPSPGPDTRKHQKPKRR